MHAFKWNSIVSSGMRLVVVLAMRPSISWPDKLEGTHMFNIGTKLMPLSFLHRKTRRASDMLSGEPNIYRRAGNLRERI